MIRRNCPYCGGLKEVLELNSSYFCKACGHHVDKVPDTGNSLPTPLHYFSREARERIKKIFPDIPDSTSDTKEETNDK